MGHQSVAVDGQPAKIEKVVTAKNEPLVFAILLDVSGSMRDRQSFEKQSALELFRNLMVGQNTGFFGDFNDELYLNRKPATLEGVLKELHEIGEFRGGTAMRDSVVEAAKLVNRFAKGSDSRRAVIVFSDGQDETSRLNLKDAVSAVQSEGVPVFCIGLLGMEKSRKKSETELQTLSDGTSGSATLLQEPKQFIPALLNELDGQCWLTLVSPVQPDRKLHSLAVETKNSDLRIYAPSAVLVR